MLEGRPLQSRVVVLTGDRFGLGARLSELGAAVASLAGPFATPDAVTRAFAAVASAHGRIDAVVHTHFPPGALVARPLDSTSADDWDERAEAPLRAALFVVQAAFAHLRDRGGRIVLMTPTAGLVGEAGFVPVATAIEGMRALAKSAARQWGTRGISVNCVAPPLSLLGAATPEPVNPPALGRTGTLDDLARTIALLAGDGAGSITGTTIPVDGGVVMLS